MKNSPVFMLLNARHLVLLVATIMISTLASAAPKSDAWAIWDASDESNTASIDHSDWQHVLETYVVGDGNGLNLFNYGGVSAEDKKRLDTYLDTMQNLDPRAYSSDEQEAYWINMYNALTVKLIVDNYPVKSITKLGGLLSFGPWDKEVAEVAGEKLTLNDIEHRILRPIWQDSRVHFAVNCASIGCPNLQGTAFTADNKEALLEKGAVDYLSHPRALKFDNDGKLHLSSIFDWYGIDFGDSSSEIFQSLSKWAPEGYSQKLASYTGRVKYDYDWGLNDNPES